MASPEASALFLKGTMIPARRSGNSAKQNRLGHMRIQSSEPHFSLINC